MGSNSGTIQLYSSTACPLQPGSSTVCWGLVLIISGASSFIVFFYATVLSKILPPSGIPFLSAIENDRYYCLLVPLTIPVLVVIVYFHWLSMKLFKHAWVNAIYYLLSIESYFMQQIKMQLLSNNAKDKMQLQCTYNVRENILLSLMGHTLSK